LTIQDIAWKGRLVSQAQEQPCNPEPGHPGLRPWGKDSGQQTPPCEQSGSQQGKDSDFFPLLSHL